MEKKDIEKIVYYGSLAPSGENCQPWRFYIKGDKIYIFNVPERDTSLYNFQQNGSLAAHGALIENMVVASKTLGYDTKISLFPESDENLVAVIELFPSSPRKDELFDVISLRATNRKPYNTVPFSSEQSEALRSVPREIGAGEVKLISDPQKIFRLAELISLNDRVLFENQELHKFLFDHIRWTEKEERKHKDGFYLKTLELKPPQVFTFKIIRKWTRLRFLNKIGISKFIAKENVKLYSASAGFGFIYLPDDSRTSFINAGRILERSWLKLTKMGMSLQPLTGLAFLYHRIFNQDTKSISPMHVDLITTAYDEIKELVGINQGVIVLMFRFGNGGEPSARSSRRPPEIKYESSAF